MPHKDRERVIDFILGEMIEIPVWPQLSAYRGEQMMIQFTDFRTLAFMLFSSELNQIG
jgi:hypothetical protein